MRAPRVRDDDVRDDEMRDGSSQSRAAPAISSTNATGFDGAPLTRNANSTPPTNAANTGNDRQRQSGTAALPIA